MAYYNTNPGYPVNRTASHQSHHHHHHSPSSSRSYSYQQGPPVGEDPQLWQWFTAVDTDRSGALSVTELQNALVNGETFVLIAFQETGQVSLRVLLWPPPIFLGDFFVRYLFAMFSRVAAL
ncbi:hypothetical protein BJ138DRAFT_1154591 [Hygrophoropsis aurantiaca]|uniref:Uncharacterized protein n=1 Tax=Hygrophoropsis aurantiaca TaxID=72124 RepID=A0ACB8A9G2_9AGAM|nr:hypothetical protein BJ138DRAFT_1154591 [Hygrophoropsis aurantiaca]